MTSARHLLDLVTEADSGSRRIARLTGLLEETITIETWGDLHPDSTPIVLVHGPRGAEKFRMTATRGALTAFARELLAGTEQEPAWRTASRERVKLIRHLHDHPEHGSRYPAGHDFVLVGTDRIEQLHASLHKEGTLSHDVTLRS